MRLTDPDFELGTGWLYTGQASRVQVPPARTGSWSGRLFARRSTLAGDVSSEITEDNVICIPGVPIPFSLGFNLDGIPAVPMFSPLLVLWDPDDGGGYRTVASLFKQDWPAGWNFESIDLDVPVGPSCALQFALAVPPFQSQGSAQVDSIAFGSDEAQLMRSTAPAFMEKLKTLILGLDPNIGHVYLTSKRWPTVKLAEDGATFRINLAGLIDDATRVGRDVTRFWWMQPSINVEPLTNGSGEYRTEILLSGFYQHEDGDAQVTALNHAAIEILDAVNTKEAELTTLNTGDAYLGFLESRPTMEAVAGATLDGLGLQGNLVQIRIRFAEEVSYA